MIEKRTYETRSVTNIRKAFQSKQRVLAVGPTGCGKTVVASMLIKQERTWRVLFVAHRYELINQAHAQLAAQGIEAGIIMASDEVLNGKERVNPTARVQVASVQTLIRRNGPEHIDLIVFDESHRVMADSYQRIAEQYPNAKVLGLTATPVRMDGKGLADFFDEMVIIAQPSELYEAGFLAKPRVFVAPVEVMLEIKERVRGAKSVNGDFTSKDLARITSGEMLVGRVVDESLRLAPRVPKLVFAGSVKHSQKLAERFRKRRIKAAHIDGDTDPHERARIIDDLAAGRIEVVCNVDVLGEGWDLPALGAVILARPTRSLARLLQMCGRVQRPYKGRVPIILDHGNSCLALQAWPGRDIEWRLDGTRESHGDGDPIVKACGECLACIPGGCTECPSCGAEQPKTVRQVREEMEAKLEEIEAMRVSEIRQRVEAMAKKKNAPRGWVERVMQETFS